jgi:hypothetical protein
MKSLFFPVFAILAIHRSSWAETSQPKEVYDYHSYGYVLRYWDTVDIYNVKAHFTFLIRLPDQVNPLNRTSVNCTEKSDPRRCLKIRSLATEVANMHVHMAETLQTAISTIYHWADALDEKRVKRSASPKWLTSALSWLTGLADENDVKTIQDSIHKLQTMVGKAAQTFAQSETHIGQVMKLTNERINTLQSLTEMTHESLNTVYKKLMDEMTEDQNVHLLLGKTVNQIQQYVSRMVEAETLGQAIQTLVTGRIPVTLISYKSMIHMIAKMNEYLRTHHPHLMIVKHDPLYYYQKAKFTTFRHGAFLYIHIECPLSSYYPEFKIYSLEKIQLQAHANDNFHTILANDIKLIGFNNRYYFHLENPMTLPQMININRSPLHLQQRRIPGCVPALLDGDATAIKQHCDFHLVHGYLEPQIIRLSAKRIFLSNISSLWFHCDSGSYNKTDEIQGKQVIIDSICACEIHAGTHILPRLAMSCNETDSRHISNYTTQYVANYFYLGEYFKQEQLASISGETTFRKAPNVSLPKLPIQEPKFKKLLAIMQKTKFSLSEAINATKADESIFTSLSHYVLEQMWQQQQTESTFNIFNYRDWALLLLSLIVATLTVLVFYLIFKIKALFVLTALATRPLPVRAADAELSLFYKTEKTTTPSNLIEISALTAKIAEIIPVDVSLLILFSILAIYILIRATLRCYKRYTVGPQTSLYLQIGNLHTSMFILWERFVYSPEFYELTTETLNDVRLEVHSFGAKSQVGIIGTTVKIEHKVLDLAIQIQPTKTVFHRTARKIREFMTDRYFLAFVTTDQNGKIRSCMQAKQLMSVVIPTSVPNPTSILYPQLSLTQAPTTSK